MESQSVDIEAMRKDHLPGVCAIEEACFSAPWPRSAFLEEIRNSFARYVVATRDNVVVGYAGMHLLFDQAAITNIAVSPDLRREGIARRLMDALLQIAREAGVERMDLEVRESNLAAQNLYLEYGFRAVARRRGYYDHPVEDALVMAREVASGQ